MKNKKYILGFKKDELISWVLYWTVLGAGLFVLIFFITTTWIGVSVREKCLAAKARYQKDNCVEALTNLLDDKSASLRERNYAIWSLGQLGDKRGKPVIEKYRHVIHFQNLKWEIDEFLGANKGLIIAEIELEINGEEDFVLTFFDYSGCVLSRRLSLVLARVNGQLIWNIVCGSNRLTIWNFLKTIKESVEKACSIQGKDEEIKYIFITDGEISFVDPVGSLFPDSIHIRQFHKKELRGLVYTHFPSSEKITGKKSLKIRTQGTQ